MKSVISFEHGETTCAIKPGDFCFFFWTKRFGTQPYCHLYEQELYEEDGWVQRCDQCLSSLNNTDKESQVIEKE